jgi:hypothetical protein
MTLNHLLSSYLPRSFLHCIFHFLYYSLFKLCWSTSFSLWQLYELICSFSLLWSSFLSCSRFWRCLKFFFATTFFHLCIHYLCYTCSLSLLHSLFLSYALIIFATFHVFAMFKDIYHAWTFFLPSCFMFTFLVFANSLYLFIYSFNLHCL